MKLFRRNGLSFALAFLFVLSGCLGSGVETAASKDAKHIFPIIPAFILGTPTVSSMNSTDSATITVTISDAVDATLSAADIGSVATGDADCTIGITNLSDTSARINLSSCTGDGTFRVYVKEAVVVSSTNTPNDASSNSTAITVDNTGPSILTITPASGPVASIPSSVVVTFSEPVDPTDIVSGLFASTGSTCGTPATPTPVLNSNNTVATVTMAGASCADSETNTVVINMALVADALGNVGSGTTTRTYTFSDGPTVTFDPAWTLTEVSSGSAVTTIDADFTSGNANVVSPTINSTSIGLTTTGGAICPTISGTGVTTNGATIRLSGCTGNGTVAVHVNAGILETASGIPNLLSADSPTFAVDNTAPALSTLTPATGTVGSPPTVQAVYDDTMNTTTITSTDVVLTGTCSGASVNTITPSVSDTTFDITFSGSCLDGETLIVSMNGNTSADSAGNTGSASAFSRTYTFDLTGPSLSSFIPASSTVNAIPASLQATFSQALSTGTMTAGDFAQSGTCGTPPSVGAPVFSGGDTIATSTLTGGSCADGETLIYTLDPSGVTDPVSNAGVGGAQARTYTFDLVGPIATTFTPATATINAIPANLEITFDQALTTGSMTNADFAQSGTCATPPTVGAPVFSSGDTVATSTLSGGTCADGETLIYTVNAAGVTDVLGNAGAGSTARTLTFDLVGPTVTVTGVNATNATVTATFSEPVSTMAIGKFVISGCTVNPTATNFTPNMTNDIFTIDLDDSGATCNSAEVLDVSVDASTVTDLPGNAGTNTDNDSFVIP